MLFGHRKRSERMRLCPSRRIRNMDTMANRTIRDLAVSALRPDACGSASSWLPVASLNLPEAVDEFGMRPHVYDVARYSAFMVRCHEWLAPETHHRWFFTEFRGRLLTA